MAAEINQDSDGELTEIRTLLDAGTSPDQVAKKKGIARNTFDKRLALRYGLKHRRVIKWELVPITEGQA